MAWLNESPGAKELLTEMRVELRDGAPRPEQPDVIAPPPTRGPGVSGDQQG